MSAMPTFSESVSERPRILIIEDHAPTRLAMGKLIRQAGAEVVTARDGEEGLNYLLTQHCDVLLTDLKKRSWTGSNCLAIAPSFPPAIVPGG